VWYMDLESKLRIATRDVEEVITLDELKTLLETGGGSGYLGFEPSGIFHVGWFVWALKFKDLVDVGIKMHLLAATWHAWINDKLGGDLRLINVAAKHVFKVLDSLGIEGRYKVVYAEELVSDPDYWATLLKSGKAVSLARVKRALTIMGRKADEGESDFSKLIYPLMQVTDIFKLGVDVALGGTDQRKAHMLQRDVAEKLGLKKVIAIHTPLIPSLQGYGKMDFSKVSKEDIDEFLAEYKMSKSKPESTIFITDTDEEIRSKVMKAYCPPKIVEGNPVIELAKHLIFRGEEREFIIERPAKYGGPIEIHTQEELIKTYSEGKIHPLDLKTAVAEYLIKFITPIRNNVLSDPEVKALLEEIKASVTR